MISGSVDSTSPSGGLVSRGECYRQRERIFFNRAQFARHFLGADSFPFFPSLHFHFHKICPNVCLVRLSVFCFRLTLIDSPDLPWSERFHFSTSCE